MSRALLILAGQRERQRAHAWIDGVPMNTRLEFKQPRRSIPQNDRMWAMLTDIARQVPWHGQRLAPDDWKLIFLDGLKRELRLAPNLDGTGFVNLGRSSSDLSKAEMSDLMELIAAWGEGHGVEFSYPGAPQGVAVATKNPSQINSGMTQKLLPPPTPREAGIAQQAPAGSGEG